MSSRRKSSTPCMVRGSTTVTKDSVEMELSADSLDRSSPVPPSTDEDWTSLKDEKEEQMEGGSKAEQGQHNPFYTQEDSITQSDVPLNTLYLCSICNFSTNKFDSLSFHSKEQHADENLFKFRQIKLDSQTVLEQTAECVNVSQEAEKTTFDSQLIQSSNSTAEDIGETPVDNNNIFGKELEVQKEIDSLIIQDEITAVSVNGTIIIPEPMSHVTPLLRRPPNLMTTPTIAVPLHSSKYNPILDGNPTLITSFNRFPYPTHAELSWLTAASKHPEEQIKVWFTTQRLKQGITWSPEEVEEARKKMFNGSIPPTHQICTILPAPIKPNHPVAQTPTCHLIGQTSVVSSITVNRLTNTCLPVTATAVSQTPILKRSLGTPILTSEIKRPVVPRPGDPKFSQCMPPPPAPPPERLTISASPVVTESKKSSPASLVAPDMKRPIVAPFVSPKVKLPMGLPRVPSREKISMSVPLGLPKERFPLSPIFSTNQKRSVACQQINKHISSPLIAKTQLSHFGNEINMPSEPVVMVPQANQRPTIIQTPHTALAAPPLSPASTTHLECTSLQPPVALSGKGFPHGDAMNWFQTANTQNDSQYSSGEFALREHPVPTHFPLLERVKGKSPGQMKLLEDSFQRNSFPSNNNIEHLMITTRLSREEIESWFLERRALRDDLEQALLNSMGSKKGPQQSRHVPPNGAHKHVGTSHPTVSLSFTPVPLDSKSMNLLKNIVVQTRWPSPAEFRHLEMQTGLARTDLVRWVRDSRLAQQGGFLELKEMFGDQNGCKAADTSQQTSQKEQLLRAETTKSSSPEFEDWSQRSRYWPSTGSNGGLIGGKEFCGSLKGDAVGVRNGAASRELVSDTD